MKNFTKSRQEYTRADGHSNSRGRQRVKSWVRPWWNRTLAPLGASGLAGGGESNVHKGLQGARRGQSWHRRLKRSHKGVVRATASNLDTLLDRGFGRRVRMLLSFQRPSHPFRKVVLHKRRVRNPNRIPERTDEYSARMAGQPCFADGPSGRSSASDQTTGSGARVRCGQPSHAGRPQRAPVRSIAHHAR